MSGRRIKKDNETLLDMRCEEHKDTIELFDNFIYRYKYKDWYVFLRYNKKENKFKYCGGEGTLDLDNLDLDNIVDEKVYPCGCPKNSGCRCGILGSYRVFPDKIEEDIVLDQIYEAELPSGAKIKVRINKTGYDIKGKEFLIYFWGDCSVEELVPRSLVYEFKNTSADNIKIKRRPIYENEKYSKSISFRF